MQTYQIAIAAACGYVNGYPLPAGNDESVCSSGLRSRTPVPGFGPHPRVYEVSACDRFRALSDPVIIVFGGGGAFPRFKIYIWMSHPDGQYSHLRGHTHPCG